MKKKLIAITLLILLIPITTTGCFASFQNDKALKGGYFTTNKADYVVLNESGGKIMDCWVLKNVYVESEKSSDGLRFVDLKGNGIIIQGDSKIIRINDKDTLNKYVNYHIDTDLIPYEQYYKLHHSIRK